jgi:hypothetical protein
VRYNLLHGRSGHIWGDRYWSEILEGEPPEWAEEWTGPVMGMEAAEFSPALARVSRWRFSFPCLSLLPCQRLRLWDCPFPWETKAGVSRWRFSFPCKSLLPCQRLRLWDCRWRLFFPCDSLLPCQRLRLWDCLISGKPAEIPRRAGPRLRRKKIPRRDICPTGGFNVGAERGRAHPRNPRTACLPGFRQPLPPERKQRLSVRRRALRTIRNPQ